MPKLKTNKSVAKRIRISKNGKIKRNRPGRRHLLSNKNGKRRRGLRKVAVVTAEYIKKFTAAMHN